MTRTSAQTVDAVSGDHAAMSLAAVGGVTGIAAADALSGTGGQPSGLGVSESAAAALAAAIALRLPNAQASTQLVGRLSVQMCRELERDEREQALVDACPTSRVRDVGMIGMPDPVLDARGRLSPQQWELVSRHPAIGADLLHAVAGMEPAAEIVRAHHERWDGGGYPAGLAGDAIPLLARVIATAEAFVAIASDRSHRRAAPADVALDHIEHERGAQFDPGVVDTLLAVLHHRRRGAATPGPARPLVPVAANAPAATTARGATERPSRSGLLAAVARFEVLPAFTPAVERALAAADLAAVSTELVAAIEGDTALTVAVLRAAQLPRVSLDRKRPIANVPDAVAAVGPGTITEVIAAVPRAPFPWQTPEQAQLYHLRVHGQTVARAAENIARLVGYPDIDDLISAALLHDVGQLVVTRAAGQTRPVPDPRRSTPEQRVRDEQHEFNLNHPTLGALLIKDWGLPARLGQTVAGHHRAQSEGRMATLLRLADLVVRHTQGDAVDRRIMLYLADVCALPIPALRDVLFDLPQSGSQRRRAQPSPLSARETEVLRALATGKRYKQIADQLVLSESTIRTHLHNTYAKLKVDDRAQAVLRATEMGWI